jgi:hypothetical protein
LFLAIRWERGELLERRITKKRAASKMRGTEETGRYWRLLLVLSLLVLTACETNNNSESALRAESLLLSPEEMPAGWITMIVDVPKNFADWSRDDRLNAARRGYVDGHLRTFTNASNGIVIMANSVYASRAVEEILADERRQVENGSRMLEGREERLQEIPDVHLGDSTLAYTVSIADSATDNFTYYEFAFTQGTVKTNIRCVAQDWSVGNPYEFCFSIANQTARKVNAALRQGSASFTDVLLLKRVEEIVPAETDFPNDWSIISDQHLTTKDFPPEMSENIGLGWLAEAQVRAFSNDTYNIITTIASAYAEKVNNNSFDSNESSELMEFNRITVLDPMVTGAMVNGTNVTPYTWWYTIQKPNSAMHANVVFAQNNMMGEVVCELSTYEESVRECERVARILLAKMQSAFEVSRAPVPALADVRYDEVAIVSSSEDTLRRKYGLASDVTQFEKVHVYNGSVYTISSPDFTLEYLVVTIERDIGFLEGDDIPTAVEKYCVAEGARFNLTVDACIERITPGWYNIHYPVVMCPLSQSPTQMTAPVGVGSRCLYLEARIPSKTDNEFIWEMARGHREVYVHKQLGIEPYSDEAGMLIDSFARKIVAARWSIEPIQVIAAEIAVTVDEPGCNPYHIILFYNDKSELITTHESVMCADSFN